MRRTVTAFALIGGASLLGFLVGLGIGQQTRQAAPSNVKTSYNDGKVTIEADIGSAVKTGATDYLAGLLR